MLKLIDSQNKYGNMNTNKLFFTDGMSIEQRNKIFLERRIAFGKDNGFDGHKVFMADQKNKDGSFHILSEKDCRDNPNGWSDIDEDILIISEDAPGIVAAHPTADCPVVIVSDRVNNIAAVCHCSAELIDIRMPQLTVDALKKAAKYMNKNVYDDSLSVYVSACAGADWTYDTYPKFAKDEEVWKYSITENKGVYNINLREAILRQLKESGFNLVTFSSANTLTDKRYYSNSMSRIDDSKRGRQLIGAFYPDNEYVKTLRK